MPAPPSLNLNDITLEPIGNGKQFSANVGRVAAMLGLQNLGCSIVELEPGNKAWPYHLHYGQEEMFVVLEGEGVIRYDDERYPVKAGDVIYTPTGEGTAHQIINTSDSNLRYLALSSREDPELAYYPDSGKFGVYTYKKADSRKRFIAHESSAVDYFEGEDK